MWREMEMKKKVVVDSNFYLCVAREKLLNRYIRFPSHD